MVLLAARRSGVNGHLPAQLSKSPLTCQEQVRYSVARMKSSSVPARLTDPALKLLRQLSLEVHAAARRDPEVSKLLVEYDETARRRIRALIETAQQARKRRGTREAESTARVLMVFLMGLNHMDTLHPHLVGDRAWRELVA